MHQRTQEFQIILLLFVMLCKLSGMLNVLYFADVDMHAGYTRLCQMLIHALYSPAHLF